MMLKGGRECEAAGWAEAELAHIRVLTDADLFLSSNCFDSSHVVGLCAAGFMIDAPLGLLKGTVVCVKGFQLFYGVADSTVNVSKKHFLYNLFVGGILQGGKKYRQTQRWKYFH